MFEKIKLDRPPVLNNKSTAVAATITVTSGLVRFLASFVTAVCLGRLLSADEFGVVNIVLPFITFFLIFTDSGIGNYILQKDYISKKLVDACFFLSFIITIFTAALFFISGSWLADIYSDNRLIPITKILSIAILLTLFTSIPNAIVKKYNKQIFFSISEIIASFSAAIVPIYLAFNNFGYYSLLAIPITRTLVHGVVVMLLVRIFPNLRNVAFEEVNTIFKFSRSLMVYQLINTLIKNIDKILIGLTSSTVILGYYSMAVSIMYLPAIQILSPVAGAVIPLLSKHKENTELFISSLENTLSRLISIISPLMIFASFYSRDLILIILGEAWVESYIYLQVLCFASILYIYESVITWAVIAKGKATLLSHWIGVSLLLYCSIVGISSIYGPEYIAYSMVLSSLVNHLLFVNFVKRYLNLSFFHYIELFLRTLLNIGAIYITLLILDLLLDYRFDEPQFIFLVFIYALLCISFYKNIVGVSLLNDINVLRSKKRI
ncbi:hypothetical protein EXU34_21685 [Alteromonas sp. ZYF713]|nr:hypothetical protein [Alteromonas sp. ZYF713]